MKGKLKYLLVFFISFIIFFVICQILWFYFGCNVQKYCPIEFSCVSTATCDPCKSNAGCVGVDMNGNRIFSGTQGKICDSNEKKLFAYCKGEMN